MIQIRAEWLAEVEAALCRSEDDERGAGYRCRPWQRPARALCPDLRGQVLPLNADNRGAACQGRARLHLAGGRPCAAPISSSAGSHAALLAPQLLIIFVFFYWPSAQALYWAFTLEQPWGGGNTWVGFDNFRKVLTRPVLLGLGPRVGHLCAGTTVLAMGDGADAGDLRRPPACGLQGLPGGDHLALCRGGTRRGPGVPVRLQPGRGHLQLHQRRRPGLVGPVEIPLAGRHRHRRGRRVEAGRLQFRLLPGRTPIHPPQPDRGRRDGRRAPACAG